MAKKPAYEELERKVKELEAQKNKFHILGGIMGHTEIA